LLASSFSYKFFAGTIPEWGLRLLTKDKLGYERFLLLVCSRKSKPASLVSPDAILLPGSKSKQKCLHLAVGIFFRLLSEVSINIKLMNPAPCIVGAFL
jgi:hypothetical protein